MKLPVDTDALRFAIPLAVLSALAYALGWAWAMWTLLGLLAFVLYFFRDPERHGPVDEELVLAPADGKVARIDTAYESPDHPDGCVCVSIFLSIFNVHVQRMPIAGTVSKRLYNKGKFMAAWNHKASLDNEQTLVTLDTRMGTVGIKQIAGLVARRIVCRAKVGQKYVKGDRMGLIRFGSRVDLILPPDIHIVSKVGDVVKGGQSVMARVPLEAVL